MSNMPNCTRWKRDICNAFGIAEAELHKTMRRDGFYASENGIVHGAPADMSNAVSVADMVLRQPEKEVSVKSAVVGRRRVR
jgi:hypothetical protein